MSSGDDVLLAIRTVLVTTRAACSHAAARDHALKQETARRGLRLLDGLATRLATSDDPRAAVAFQAARAELLELVRTGEVERVAQRN